MPKKKPYDMDMIRDFLDHLTLELEIHVREHTDLRGGPGESHRLDHRLTKKLTRFLNKYEVTGFFPCTRVFDKGCTQEQIAKFTDFFDKKEAARATAQLEHLAALKDLFTDALCYGRNTGHVATRDIHTKDYLAEMEHEEGENVAEETDPKAQQIREAVYAGVTAILKAPAGVSTTHYKRTRAAGLEQLAKDVAAEQKGRDLQESTDYVVLYMIQQFRERGHLM